MKIEQVSCDSVMLRYPAHIDEQTLDKVQRDFLCLHGSKGFFEVVPSYASIWIRYDHKAYSMQRIRHKIASCLNGYNKTIQNKSSHIFEIAVDYGQGIDLERIARHSHLGIKEVIALHSNVTYRVYAIGFMVGFAYLGVVDKRIVAPRLATPRSKVPKGAVAIANEQTAIYPKESAGGWNIVGVTAFEDFDKFSIGDIVCFASLKKGSDGI